MKNTILLACLACLLSCQHQTPKQAELPKHADLLLLNGNFFTADSTRLQATALAIGEGRILYVGDDAGALALKDSATQVVDLQGAFAMPGFIEGHGHFYSLGSSLQNLNFTQTKSWQQITALVAEKAKQAKPGDWIEGRGWHQEKWSRKAGRTVNGYPYHDALSAVSPNNPVVLFHASGHALIANEKAMQQAGISAETADPVGGRIVRDAAGKLTGVFEENAMDLIKDPLDAWKKQRPEAERQAAFDTTIAIATRECLAKGITSFEDAGSDFWEIDQYQRLAESGKLGLRLWVMIARPGNSELPKLNGFPKVGLGNGFLTVRAVKAYLDGALGSYGAWLLQPYTDKPDGTGQTLTPLDTLRQLAEHCGTLKLQLCVHAIGDRANREVLNIFQEAMLPPSTGSDSAAAGRQPVPQLRWRIEHAQHLDPADIPRFHQLGVIASMQAIHCTSDAPFVVKRLGLERARTGAYAWRSLLDSGARLANGTDTPVEDVDPLPCLYAAVTRKRTDTGLTFFPEQAMTREEALFSYTLWNAYAAFEEKEKGSLSVGKSADIAVLSKDLLHCRPEEILKAKVLKVYVGGQLRYEKSNF